MAAVRRTITPLHTYQADSVAGLLQGSHSLRMTHVHRVHIIDGHDDVVHSVMQRDVIRRITSNCHHF